jgi:hypothetical protein
MKLAKDWKVKEEPLKWSKKGCFILDKSIRSKEDGTSYCVFKVGTLDDFDNFKLTYTKKKRRKLLTVMCFSPPLFERIRTEELYDLEGIVSFGYGSTYFCIEAAKDELGIKVGSGNGVEFTPLEEIEDEKRREYKKTTI